MDSHDTDAVKGTQEQIILEGYEGRGEVNFKNYFSTAPTNSKKIH